jgi:hypothetical protein
MRSALAGRRRSGEIGHVADIQVRDDGIEVVMRDEL